VLTYYGFLATRVAPRRLLATAARRAVRGARNRLAPPLAPSPERLLEILGCSDLPSLAALLGRSRPAPPAWTPGALRRALDRHVPGEAERAIARAEAAADGRVEVYGRALDARRADGGLDWQRDLVNGGRFACAPSGALPGGPRLDPKMAWALARGEQWIALAEGAVLDGRRGDALAAALSGQVQDFARANPVGQGVHWTSAMEAALRAWNLTVALWILSFRRRAPDPGLALEAARLAVATGRFVLAHLEDDTAVPNNHLATDWLGLLACAAALPEWPEAPRWRALATGGLRRAIAEQVNADGTSFEGSVAYQRFSTELFAAGLLLAHAGRSGLGRDYARRLAGLFRSTRALLSASGELPQLGDNDSGRALAIRPRGPTEGGYLLPLGAALLRDPALLVVPGAGGAAEVAWLLGPAPLEWLARARPGPPPRSAVHPDGGYHALRRGAVEAFVSCGPNGQRGIGGHNHNDKLALELFVGGVRAVCDPGMPVYGRDPALRDAFRSTRAHATVVVDGLEQAPLVPGRIFALPEAAAARVIDQSEGAAAAHLAGEHRGFVARTGVVHRRELWAAADGLVVVDRLLGRGTHAIELRWPLASTRPRLRPVSPAEADGLARLARLAGLRRPADPLRAVEVPLGGEGLLLVAFSCPAGLEPELGPALRAPGYGRLEDATAILLAAPVACPAALATLFLHLPAGSPAARSAPP
jgi:heparinase II/III-like protein